MALWILGPDPAGNCCDCTGRTGPCDTCGEPSACQCALLIPPFASPYADYATAVAVIADQTDNCIGFVADDWVSITATEGINSLILGGVVSTGGDQHNRVKMWGSMALRAGSLLSFTWNCTSAGINPAVFSVITIEIYDCNGIEVGSYSQVYSSSGNASGSWTGPDDGGIPPPTPMPFATDGVYYIMVQFESIYGNDVTSVTANWTITSDDTAVVNPVIAQWDNSGTTRQLEACPKMLLPPLTESSGSWYANCASAAAITDSSQVSNCCGYIESLNEGQTFSATNGGTSLEVNFTATPELPPASPAIWGGFNAVVGKTVSVAYIGYVGGDVNIYDYNGALVESHTGTTTPFVSSSLPYTGRYIIRLILSNDTGGTGDATATITSSGDMSVNEIQALYDTGLTCAARLDCGDACP